MQVLDNQELSDLMLDDLVHAPDIYKSTKFWTVYEKIFLPELRKLRFRDFRRRKKLVLSSFEATDLVPSYGINLFESRIFYNLITSKIPSIMNWRSVYPFVFI